MQKSPPPFCVARFEEKNILDCAYFLFSCPLVSLPIRALTWRLFHRALYHCENLQRYFHRRIILPFPHVQRGPPDSPYAGGEYHGLIMFPSEYPYVPPRPFRASQPNHPPQLQTTRHQTLHPLWPLRNKHQDLHEHDFVPPFLVERCVERCNDLDGLIKLYARR